MPGNDLGPPEKERPGGLPSRQGQTRTDTTTNQPPQSTARGAVRLWRRGRALLLCGCIGDPHAGCHRHDHSGDISDVQAEGAVTAIEHLDALGTPGLLDDRTCRAMRRIGHRALAEAVHRRTTGAT